MKTPLLPLLPALTAALLCLAPLVPAGAAGDDHATEALRKGPLGGRLLTDDDGFNLEITIAERGIPPEFRVFPRQGSASLPPDQVTVEIRLHRTNGLPEGITDRHRLVPAEQGLRSPSPVYEPHSFAVEIIAEHDGRRYRWQYDSPEGRVDIDPDMADRMGLHTTKAGAAEIRRTRPLYGRITVPEDRQWTVGARYPGLVQTVAVRSGEAVRKGQLLARVQSSDSLRSYAVTAPADGIVVDRRVSPGALVSGPMFRLLDPTVVWAELWVFPGDREGLQVGAEVRVRQPSEADGVDGTLTYLSPTADAHQARRARVVIDNRDGRWTPGTHVEAEVTIARQQVPLVVPLAAVQTFRDWEVVFVRDGNRFQALPLTLGTRDRDHVEVLDGLSPGAAVVTTNAYLLKADLEKSGAAHDH